MREEKIKASEELARKLSSYKTIAVIDLFKTPTKQLQIIKKRLGLDLKVYKKSTLMHALELVDGKLVKIKDWLPNQFGLIFSNEEPFSLFMKIKKEKAYRFAKAGDVAESDVQVKAGQTDIPAGPVISEFAKARIPASVQSGKIVIKKDVVVVKGGEKISKEIASILHKLKLMPVSVTLNLACVYGNGEVYGMDTLNLVLEYPKLLAKGFRNALNLSVNLCYPTKENIKVLLTKAYTNAKALVEKLEVRE